MTKVAVDADLMEEVRKGKLSFDRALMIQVLRGLEDKKKESPQDDLAGLKFIEES